MVSWKNDYIGINKYTRPGTKLNSVKAIVIHWTANPGASASNHKTYFANGAGQRYASAHIFVDSKESLCIIPLNEVAYAANETGKSKIAKLNGNYGYSGGNANGCTVSVEMCVEKDGSISKTVESKTVQVVADLCKKFGLTEKDVYRHYDITGKSCPTPFITSSSRFTNFKKEVSAILNKKVVTEKKATYFTAVPASKKIKAVKKLNVYNSVEFTDKTKTSKSYAVGSIISITGISKSKSGTTRFKTKDGYISTNKEYSKEQVAETKSIGTVKVLVNDLNYYNGPRWKNPTGTVSKNTVLTITEKVTVEKNLMYKTITGNYITANSKYVKFTK